MARTTPRSGVTHPQDGTRPSTTGPWPDTPVFRGFFSPVRIEADGYDLVILDALDIAAGPIATVKIPFRLRHSSTAPGCPAANSGNEPEACHG